MQRDTELTCVNLVLLATAFAAGAVDIIGFSQLGGVFASAMTGNFALLAWHVARGNSRSAIGSVISLAGFVFGCVCAFTLQRRRSLPGALRLLLSCEVALLFVFAMLALFNGHPAPLPAARLQIIILAAAMGIQAVVGQTVSLSTIVFTTTLTRLVGGIIDRVSGVNSPASHDIAMHGAVVFAYLFGAVLAGVLAVQQIPAVAFLPLIGVAIALLLVARHAWQVRT